MHITYYKNTPIAHIAKASFNFPIHKLIQIYTHNYGGLNNRGQIDHGTIS